MQHSDEQLDAFAAWERAAWEQRAAPYATSLTDLTGGAAPALLDAAGVGAGTRVLDVATGPGVVAAAALARGAAVTAVDQSASMVELARTALPGVRVVQAPAERLPFVNGEFDAVVAGFLLNHLARPDVGLAELVRVLAPGGRVALSVWDVPDANPVLGLFGPVAESLGLSADVPAGPDPATFADPGRFHALLAAAGLHDVRVERTAWAVTVEPGPWFDAVAAATPRTGAVLAQRGDDDRARLRDAYVRTVRERFDAGDGRVRLPAAAVVGSGASPT